MQYAPTGKYIPVAVGNGGGHGTGYKSAVTKQMNQLNAGKHDQSSIVWQRSYYEHIIRNPQSYQNIADYIMNNPAKWNADAFHTI
ncbi:MAG: hypothetical protein ACTHJT_12000 [Cytophaga sp.]|uniref:hypothetical protein n=1 Tax=Cytophaga sp. TaxID=29535 RepID=UPI003F7E87E0